MRDVYDDYLQDFEKHYTMMVLDKLVKTNTAVPSNFQNMPQNPPQAPPQSGMPPGGPQTQPNPINPKMLIQQLVQGNLTVEMMRSKGVPEPLVQQVDMLRRRTGMNIQGMATNRPPAGQAPLSLPPGSENFSGNGQNGPPLRSMPPGQVQGQIPNQILAKTTPERLQAAGLIVKRMSAQAIDERGKSISSSTF